MGGYFARGIRAAGIKRRGLVLRRGGRSEHFRRSRLIHADRVPPRRVIAHRFEDPQCSRSHDIGGVFGLVEADPHVRLSRQMVHFVGLRGIQYVAHARAFARVAVMETQSSAALMRIGVNPIQALGVEGGGSPHDAMDLIPLGQQQFRQERPVLPGDTGNQRFLHVSLSVYPNGASIFA